MAFCELPDQEQMLNSVALSPVHIPHSPSSCYTIKKQFHVRSAVFLEVHLTLLSLVLIRRCIILLTDFSSSQSYSLQVFLSNFLKCSGHFQRDFVSDSQKNRLSDTFTKHIPHGQGSNFKDRTQITINFFFNNAFIIYPCMRRMSRTAIEDNRKYTVIKRWLETKLCQVRT